MWADTERSGRSLILGIFDIFQEGLIKSTKKLSQDSRSPGRYLSLEPLEYEQDANDLTATIGTVMYCMMFNPLRLSGNYMNHLLWLSVMMHFVFIRFVWFLLYTAIISLNSVNRLIFVMVQFGVLFEVRTEFLKSI
jgi:hypothetical protein